MKNLISVLLLLFALCAFGQTTPAVNVNFPSTVLPVGLAVFGEYNQLATPTKFSGGLVAIYPVSGSLGIYGTTITSFLPVKATDPTTGKLFYAVSTSVRQGFHKSLIQTGALTFLVGADVGPSITQSATPLVTGGTASYSVSFSTSATGTFVYQLSRMFSLMVPIRMLYVTGIGWNPVAEAGVIINLKNLPKAK